MSPQVSYYEQLKGTWLNENQKEKHHRKAEKYLVTRGRQAGTDCKCNYFTTGKRKKGEKHLTFIADR